MKKVLVTGGAGFIGRSVCTLLLQKGYDLVVLDNLSEQVHGNNASFPGQLKMNATCVKGDVRNVDDWHKALTGVDAIVHLAAETGTGQSMYTINKYVSTNIGGTSNLLEILANEKTNVKKVLLSSSRAVYGEGRYHCVKDGYVYPVTREDSDMQARKFECKCPICGGSVELVGTTEDSLIHPTSIYGITKATQEQLLMVGCKSLGISATVLRYQNVYGPGQSLSNPYTGILSIFSTRIKNGNGLNIFEDGRETRDFVYIDDIATATVMALENSNADYKTFNVGLGEITDVLTVANTLKDAYHADVDIKVSGSCRVGDIRHNYADISSIANILGFHPAISFKEGISNFVEWVNTQKVLKDKYEDSIQEMKQKGLYK